MFMFLVRRIDQQKIHRNVFTIAMLYLPTTVTTRSLYMFRFRYPYWPSFSDCCWKGEQPKFIRRHSRHPISSKYLVRRRLEPLNSLLRRCLGIWIPPQKVFGCIGYIEIFLFVVLDFQGFFHINLFNIFFAQHCRHRGGFPPGDSHQIEHHLWPVTVSEIRKPDPPIRVKRFTLANFVLAI